MEFLYGVLQLCFNRSYKMLTQERLKELLSYNKTTGIFTRLTDNKRGRHIGDVAGNHHSDGYIYIYVDGETYAAHRLAWLYVHGQWPIGDLDHKYGQEAGNGIDNLREATHKTNMQNERRPRSNNKSGFLGVHWRKERQRWVAQLRVNGKSLRFGSFKTAEEAHSAYLAAKRKYHDGCLI